MAKKDKKMCSGCRNDRYNHKGMCERPGIDAQVTSDECWSFKSAKVVWKKEVPLIQTPPWNQKAIPVLDCYSQSGYAYIDKDKVR